MPSPLEVQATVAALRAVRNPRFLATERGFQGAFYCALRGALMDFGMIDDARIVEMEYQKSSRHGLSQRPDIVYHIPAEVSGVSVGESNFAVWALKHAGATTAACEDFTKLDEMCHTLGYPLALFVNVSAMETHLGSYRGPFRDRIHAFATPASAGSAVRHEYFEAGVLRTEDHSL